MGLEEANFITEIFIEAISIKAECKDLGYIYMYSKRLGYLDTLKIIVLELSLKKDPYQIIRNQYQTLDCLKRNIYRRLIKLNQNKTRNISKVKFNYLNKKRENPYIVMEA